MCLHVSDSFATAWTVAHKALLSMGFPRQEYWRRLSLLTPKDLLNPRIKPASSLESPALPCGFFTTMAPHSSTLAWKIPWTEEPVRLQSMGSLSRTRLSNFTFTFHIHALEKAMATHSSVLAWRIPGTGEPGGLPSMGLHRVGHYWSDLA